MSLIWLEGLVSTIGCGQQLTRRTLLTGGLALCGLSSARLFGHSTLAAPPRSLRFDPFTLGIASGDPSADGMVLWTRLAPDPLRGGGMPPVAVDVAWELAEDERMQKVLRRGVARAVPEWAHSVHVEVSGLAPDRWYWYRFRVGDAATEVGRTRTLPRPGAPVDRLRFAFASCQHYETGYFTALRHLSEETLDVVFHLGDYIYESRGNETQVRYHTGPEIVTLEHYRNRHAQYRTDRDLQAAHAAFPVDRDLGRSRGRQQLRQRYFGEQRPAGCVPACGGRPRTRPTTSTCRCAGRRFRAARRCGCIGTSRTAAWRRSSCWIRGSTATISRAATATTCRCARGSRTRTRRCSAAPQERWLVDGLDRSGARWNVLPQQIMMAKVDLRAGPEIGVSADQWSALRRRTDARPRVLRHETARQSDHSHRRYPLQLGERLEGGFPQRQRAR